MASSKTATARSWKGCAEKVNAIQTLVSNRVAKALTILLRLSFRFEGEYVLGAHP